MRTTPLAALLLASLPAFAATAYPDKPIRLIVPVAPGGGADITARAVAQKLAAAWGQQIIIDNRAGAGGTVGMEIGARATPDGYTLIEGSMGPLTVDMSLYSKLPYDSVRDFTPIARGVTALNMLVVHPSLPVNSVKELIVYAKANPAKLNFGSSGAGRADHLAGEMFNTFAGVKMQHVPYKGGAPAMVDLVGGNIQLIFATVSTAITSVKAGRIRPLAMTTASRVDLFPDLPTVAEAGVPELVRFRRSARPAAGHRRQGARRNQSRVGRSRCQNPPRRPGHIAIHLADTRGVRRLHQVRDREIRARSQGFRRTHRIDT
jgi:tripartite-type tricarboxylate transporter receptor subunit TctC